MSLQREPHRSRDTSESAIPVLDWLPKYERSWLRPDVIAGFTVAAAVIPEALAYASLASMPPQTGLYAALIGVLVFAVFTTSRQVIAGPTSALAILIAAGVGGVAAGNAAEYVSLVALTTILVGIVGIVAWVLHLGFLVNFISGSVLTGFASGAALYIMSTQFGKLLGISGSSGTFFERLWFVLTNLNGIQSTTAVVGLVSIVLLVLGERYVPRIPTALVVVLLAIGVSAVVDLESRGVEVVGALQRGLPSLTVPPVPDVTTISAIVPVALALFLLSYVQGIGATETFARRHDQQVDPNQELLSTGASNVLVGLFGGFPVGGSMSRSALNDAVGGKSQVASGVIAVVLIAVLLFLTGLFTTLPETTLAAVIIVAVAGIVDIAGLRRLRSVNRDEFVIAAAAFLGVLGFGMLWGVFIGVGLSLIFAIARSSDPKTEVLARTPGTDNYVNQRQHPDTVEDVGVLVYRVDAGLFFANTVPVRDDLLDRISERDAPPELVVLDLYSSPMVDLAAADMLGDLHRDLDAREIDFQVAGANSQVRSLLEAAGLDETLGTIGDEETIASVIDRWKRDADGSETQST